MENPSFRNGELSQTKILYAKKAARSITEIQQNVNNIADIVAFLDVLGYSDDTVRKNGFVSQYELAEHTYDYIDLYYNIKDRNSKEDSRKFLLPVPGVKQRIIESLEYMAPWIGSLILLYTMGLSLWMAVKLPRDVLVAFVVGVFVGLIFTEGPLQLFMRILSFYHSQGNIAEVKRALKRSYIAVSIMLLIIVTVIFFASVYMDIPYELMFIVYVSTITISFHRISYIVLYVLKKRRQIVISYMLALGILILAYSLIPYSILPDAVARYFLALISAFIALSVFAAYYTYKIMTKHTSTSSNSSPSKTFKKDIPHFYIMSSTIDNTIKSRFSIQLWENMSYFLFGIFYLILLFGDRIMSWVFNPETVVGVTGTILPLGFNAIYHIGADLALFIMVPVTLIQYIIIQPVYILIHNMSLETRVSDRKSFDRYIQSLYRKLVLTTVLVAIISYVVLNLIGPELILRYLGGTIVSIEVLRLTSIGYVALSIFAANSIMMIFMNKSGTLSIITIVSVTLLVIISVVMSQVGGFENVAGAFLISTSLGAFGSTIVALHLIRRPSRFFARYL